MRFSSFTSLIVIGSALALTACQPPPPKMSSAYWQRIEAQSALYLTGPKAQQRLEENIAGCVHEIDELVELNAIRETIPPDTYNEYNQALEDDGGIAHWDTPTHLGNKMVDHSDYHNFESCMQSKGWERTKYVRYQTDQKAKKTYKHTQQIREYGMYGDSADAKKQNEIDAVNDDYSNVNE